jgi:pimeloyl-ACP methyl ester carboxylesterase
MGLIAGWPGIASQPMVAQIRSLLEPYGARIEFFEGSGHAPFLDAAERWADVFFDFLASVE